MTAFAYEPFVLFDLTTPFESFIERVLTDARLGDRIAGWKQLSRDGWDVTVLLAPDSRSLVALGVRELR